MAQSPKAIISNKREHLATANAMSEKMGYGRRKLEVEVLRLELEELKI